ncbi:MAG: DUF6452 family protein [Flavobacteriaceae bacterium]
MIIEYFRTLMHKLRAIFLIILGFILINSCEKDDICVEGDTPLLIITFYDAENPEEPKTVSSLRVQGLGQESPVDTFTDRSSLDSISIPLRINQPDTGFLLILDSATEDDAETGNIDTLSFSYTTQEVFVSKACGFIANYDELNESLTTDAENWIQSIEIISSTINSQASAHVQIFH